MAKLPTNPEGHQLLEDSRRKTRRQEMGLFGLLGSGPEKPANIVALAIILAFVCLAAVIFGYPDSGEHLSKKDLITPLISLITLALGYLFGRSSKGE